MELDVRFFATFREAVGAKELAWEIDEDTTVGDVLSGLEAEYEAFDGQLLADGNVRPQLNVLKNGRNVEHADGVETEITGDDQLSVFPPVAGG